MFILVDTVNQRGEWVYDTFYKFTQIYSIFLYNIDIFETSLEQASPPRFTTARTLWHHVGRWEDGRSRLHPFFFLSRSTGLGQD